jgi:crotonobetainyl-CoA:carnitine CoA-transferase CaiB-like acyl-CoA transferase
VPYELFATADGWLVLNIGNDGQWRAFCTAADAGSLGAEARFATNRQRVEHRDELVPKVADLLRSRPTAEWERRLGEAGVPHAVVRNYAEVFADPQTAARGMKITVHDRHGRPMDLVGNPVHLTGAAVPDPHMPPELGAQTDEVLRTLAGIDEQKLAGLRARGII